MLANAAATNYGFAFRWPRTPPSNGSPCPPSVARTGPPRRRLAAQLVYEEDVDGETALVHRHNSCRAFPANDAGRDRVRPRRAGAAAPGHRPDLVLPGGGGPRRRVEPLLGLSRGGHRDQRLRCSGVVWRRPPERSTLEFGYSGAAPTPVRHLDDNGVNAALEVLVRNGLVTPVARMRPIAVLR